MVYGIREKRKGVCSLFRGLASIYFRVLGSLRQVGIPVDTGDFLLGDKDVFNILIKIRCENSRWKTKGNGE